ncbi:ATP-binding cassette transporter yor1 [Paecilomyces lecythidis]
MADSTGGEDVVKPQQKQQKKWYPTLMILSKEKPPVPKERTVCPEYNAGFLSTLTFQWTAPLLAVGWKRPIELNDIWLVNPDRSASKFTGELKERFNARVKAGSKRPLAMAIYETFKLDFIIGAIGALTASMSQVLIPFVLKYLISFATEAFVADKTHTNGPPIGKGIGYVFCIAGMQIISSVGMNHFMYRGMVFGGEVRSALTSLIFDKAMTISGRAKAGGKVLDKLPSDIKPGSEEEKEWYAKKLEQESGDDDKEKRKAQKARELQGWSNGRIINLMSMDTYRIDKASGWFHLAWSSPVSIIVTIILLLINLTYSALPGIGIFFLAVPTMGIAVKSLLGRRAKANKFTDERVSLTQEVLQGIRFVKYYNWERDFLQRISDIRNKELRSVQMLLGIRNGINAFGVCIPVFASMLAFITFQLSKHPLNPAPVFSSLALFNQLRQPLTILPMIIGLVADAFTGIGRIEQFLLAEDQKDDIEIDKDSPDAIAIQHADFTWEANPDEDKKGPQGKNKKLDVKRAKKEAKKAKKTKPSAEHDPEKMPVSSTDVSQAVTPYDSSEENPEPQAPFKIVDINLDAGKQELIGVIGSVGSGKSSLLSAIAGDMRRLRGSAVISGSRAFCPQQAWIQNATILENITFGSEFDKDKYDRVIEACALEHDLEMLPHGNLTEVGERGINLSGGQKQRLSLARAIYSDADIVLLDDPLSAVDAHVGRHLMQHAICGLLKDKCRILATHQLHTLKRCDRIIIMHDGRITAFDTFDSLMEKNEEFQSIMETVDTTDPMVENKPADQNIVAGGPKKQKGDSSDALMQEEDRAVKGVPMSVYVDYCKSTGSVWIAPMTLFFLIISQGSNTLTGLWLAWWSSDKFGLSTGAYIGIYAALGVIAAVTVFSWAVSVSILGTRASKGMLRRALQRVVRAPMSFFDTTPLGRVMNRLSKDVDTMDNNLSDSIRMACMTIASLVATFILTIAYYYYFAAALVPLFALYIAMAMYYRPSAREVNRHEAVLRSHVFARFNEAVLGTPTVRAYGLQKQFSVRLNDAIDNMNSAYFLTFANQRWLNVRIDAIGIILTFIVCMLVVTSRFEISPSISGLVLSYVISIMQMLQFTVRQVTEMQNNMNSAERLHYYGLSLEQEAPEHTAVDLPKTWPEHGEIVFDDVQMRYRAELPLVLQGLSLHIKPGEKVGIVGRTGAGKSSIMSALFRLVELSGGSITIDNININTVGLSDLRSRMSIIPQDPTLFKGTVRSNLDPFSTHSDLELWSALRQAGLVDSEQNHNETAALQNRVTLDTPVDDQGQNFSLGQRQLMALARALVRNSQIIICDEATSSVDFETDRRIQRTILDGFRGKTLLCIAHRLKTIIGYDRICLIDQGRVGELGTPLELFDQGGVFRGMCERSSIGREEIIEAREQRDSI